MTRHINPTVLQINLQRLLFIRLIAFVCQILALLYARYILRLSLNYVGIIGIFVLLALLNGGLYLRLRRLSAPRQQEFFVHLLLDIAGLSVLLYLTGGASNPFISYFLVPVTIAAATLSWSYTWLLSALALVCYTLLLFYFQPLPQLMPEPNATIPMDGMTTIDGISLHIVGMWFNFVVSAALITWFVVRMADEIRRQDLRIRRYREDTLRDEKILAVATQAAGTAHELGTPLGTMAVLLKDMTLENADAPVLRSELKILTEQVNRCRIALQSLSRKADYKNQQPEVLLLTGFIDQMLEQWQLLRPELPITVQKQPGEAPQVHTDPALRQALINILNNAADASPQGISVDVSWTTDSWCLRVRDQGSGLSRELLEHLGTQILSTKEDGMGIGLVISQATINRLGGKVSLYPQENTGTLTEIFLPVLPPGNAEDA